MKLNIRNRYIIEINTHEVCRRCDKVFRKRNWNHSTCDDCKNKEKEKIGTIQVCIYCGSEYVQKWLFYRYCSKECAKKNSESKSRLVILERDNFQCIYCGKTSYEDNVKLHVDHIYPKSKDGKDVAGNLVTACQECNLSKSSKVFSNIDLILNAVKSRNEKNDIDNDLKINL